MRARADVKGVEQPRNREEPCDADHDVNHVIEGPRAEDVGEHVGLPTRQADDPPVEGADDHEEENQRLESPQHLHRLPPCESETEKVLIATYLHRDASRVTDSNASVAQAERCGFSSSPVSASQPLIVSCIARTPTIGPSGSPQEAGTIANGWLCQPPRPPCEPMNSSNGATSLASAS